MGIYRKRGLFHRRVQRTTNSRSTGLVDIIRAAGNGIYKPVHLLVNITVRHRIVHGKRLDAIKPVSIFLDLGPTIIIPGNGKIRRGHLVKRAEIADMHKSRF